MRVRLKARAPSGGNIARRAGMAHARVAFAPFKAFLCTAWRHLGRSFYRLTLALTKRTSFDRRNPLLWVLLPITLVNLCRLEDSHGTAAAALLALAAPPPVWARHAASSRTGARTRQRSSARQSERETTHRRLRRLDSDDFSDADLPKMESTRACSSDVTRV